MAKIKKKIPQKGLYKQKRLYTIQNVREIVLERMKQLGISGYALSRMTEGHVSQQTISNFVLGSSIQMDNLSHILAAVGLSVVAIPGYRPDATTRKSAGRKRKQS